MTSPKAAHSTRPIFSYTDDGGLFGTIYEELSRYVPFKNLEYKFVHPWTEKETVRVIDKVEIEFRKYGSELFGKSYGVGGLTGGAYTGSGFPFVHIFITNCEDIDVYRTTIRPRITDWLNTISSKRNQEHVIVYVSNSESSKNPIKFLTGKSSGLWDKIKTDFGGKRDRCANVRLPISSNSDTEAWLDFISKLRDGLLTSFDSQVDTFKEEIVKSESQETLPGWNYNQYFLLKESLAYLYETMNLPDLSVTMYQQLEEKYLTLNESPPAVWFKTFGGLREGDDSSDPMDTKRIPYQNLIMTNEITIFDFRIYLFARQCQLYFKMQAPDKACSMTKYFVTNLGKTLELQENGLSKLFIESFTYSVCTAMVQHCEELVAVSPLDDKSRVLYEGSKAELLQYARLMLDVLGCRCGWLKGSIHGQHGSQTLQVEKANVMEPAIEQTEEERKLALLEMSQGITNEELKQIMVSEEVFDDLYMKLTNRAIKCLETSSTRQRTLHLLKADLAFLHASRNRYQEAITILSELCLPSTPSQPPPQDERGFEGWYLLDNWLLDLLKQCALKTSQMRTYAMALLQLIHNWSVAGSNESVAKAWLDELITASSKLDGDITRNIGSLMSIQVTDLICQVGDDDGLILVVNIKNFLPVELNVDQVQATLVGNETDLVFLESGVTFKAGTKRNPGITNVRLKCEKTSVASNYVVEKVTLTLGHLQFVHNYLATKKITFYVPETRGVVEVKLMINETMVYGDQPNSVLVKVFTRHHGLHTGSLQLTPLTGLGILWPKTVTARITSELNPDSIPKERHVEYVDGKFVLPSCAEQEVIEFPLSFGSEGRNVSEHAFKITLLYTREDGRKRLLMSTEKFSLSIPWELHHQLHPDAITSFLQVSATNTGTLPMRVTNVTATSGPGLTVKPVVDLKESLVFEKQMISFAYCVSTSGNTEATTRPRSESRVTPDTGKIQISLKYHCIAEELESYILLKVFDFLSQANMTSFTGFVSHFIRDHAISTVDIASYAATGRWKFGPLDNKVLMQRLHSEETSVKEQVVHTVGEIWNNISEVTMDDVVLSARTRTKVLTYTIDGPMHKILLVADISACPTANKSPRHYEGDPVPCQITLRPLLWNSVKEAIDVEVVVDIDYRTWLFAGQQRAIVSLSANSTPATFPCTLIPLTTGSLIMPSIQVTLCSGGTNNATGAGPPVISAPTAASILPIHVQTINQSAGRQLTVCPRKKSATICIWESVGNTGVGDGTREDYSSTTMLTEPSRPPPVSMNSKLSMALDMPDTTAKGAVGFSVYGYGSLRKDRAISIDSIPLS